MSKKSELVTKVHALVDEIEKLALEQCELRHTREVALLVSDQRKILNMLTNYERRGIINR